MLRTVEDGTYAIVDYESIYKRISKIKYLNYIVRVKAFAFGQTLKNIIRKMRISTCG